MGEQAALSRGATSNHPVPNHTIHHVVTERKPRGLVLVIKIFFCISVREEECVREREISDILLEN